MKKRLTTKSYNFRLDPRVPKEKVVIDALQDWIKDGYTVRQVITELVFAHQDIQLSEPRSEYMSTKVLRRLEHLINDEVLTVLKEIRSGNPATLANFAGLPKANVADEGEPIDTEMLEAIRRARRGQSMKRKEIE